MRSTGFRFRHRKLGGHVHVRVFAGPAGGTYGNCGTLVFREEEWADLNARLSVFAEAMQIETVPDEERTL